MLSKKETLIAISMLNSINPNASINKSVSVSSKKLFACDAGFNLKQGNFPMLPINVSVCNSVNNPDKPIVKFVCKSILKTVSTSSFPPGKSIDNIIGRSSKLVSTNFVRPSKPIFR